MSDPFLNTDKVNAVIRVRRGPEVDRTSNTYEDGEIVWSSDKKRLFVGDTGTYGGILAGNKTWIVDNFNKLSNVEYNDCVFRTDTNAFYVLTGDNYLVESNYILLGGAKLVQNNVTPPSPYTLPDATTSTKGGIIVGNGLKATNAFLEIDFDPTTLAIVGNKLKVVNMANATYTTKGIVQIKDGTSGEGGLKVSNGDLNVNIDNSTIKLSSNNTLYVHSSPQNFFVADEFGNLSTDTITISSGLKVSNRGIVTLHISNIVGTGLSAGVDNKIYLNTSDLNSSPFAAKAWALFDGSRTGSYPFELTGTEIKKSYNISNINKDAVGTYTLVFSNSASDVYYMGSGSVDKGSCGHNFGIASIITRTLTSVTIGTGFDSVGSYVLEDSSSVNFAIFG